MKKAPDDGRTLVNHRTVARRMSVTTKTFRSYVERGIVPLPHLIAEPLWFYRSDAVDTFIDTGKWPDFVKFRNVGRVA